MSTQPHYPDVGGMTLSKERLLEEIRVNGMSDESEDHLRSLLNERVRYRALLSAALHFLSVPDTTGIHSPDFCGSRQDLVSKIKTALQTDKTNGRE